MKFKYYHKTVVPVVLILFIFRCIELWFLVEPGTEYYKPGDFYHYIFNGIYFLVAIFYISAYFFLSKKVCGIEFITKASVHKRIMFFFPGFFIIVNSVIDFLSYFINNRMNLSLIKSLDFYILITAVLAAVSLIRIALYPNNINLKSPYSQILTLSLPINYVLRLFDIYIKHDGLVSKTFGTFEVLKVASISICLMCFSKAFISSCKRKNFTIFLWLSTVFTAIRLADTLFAVINNETQLLSINIIQQLSDCLLVISLLLVYLNLYKKRKLNRNIIKKEFKMIERENNPVNKSENSEI